MYGVELYAAVRLAVVDQGLSHHEAGRRFGIDRRTAKKTLSYSAPPGYRRTKPVRRPKLDGFTGIVDAILEADTDPDVVPSIYYIGVINDAIVGHCNGRVCPAVSV